MINKKATKISNADKQKIKSKILIGLLVLLVIVLIVFFVIGNFVGSRSLLKYTIINNGKESIKLDEYEMIVKDKDDNIVATLIPTLDYELAPGETYDTGNAIDIDLSAVKAIELVMKGS